MRFYGIPTESQHIVFVLDRSGSMKEKAGDKSAEHRNSVEGIGVIERVEQRHLDA